MRRRSEDPRQRASPRQVSRALLVPLGLLVVGLVILLWRALFGGETFSGRDLALYYHPAKALVAPLARASGGIPVWNPLFASGQPFAANPEHEFFYPLTALFFLLPFELAFRLQVVVPLAAAFPSMYAFLRILRRSRPAAGFGGLAWTLGGYLLSTTNLLPILFAVAILPLTLSLLVRTLRAPSALHTVALASCLGIQCMAGEPSTLVMLPPVCVAATFAVRKSRAPGGPAHVLVGILLGVGMGAITILPGLHHASKTPRAAGLHQSTAGDWSMPAVRAVELFAPHVLGDVVDGKPERFWGARFYPNRSSPYFFSLYPGLAVTLLAFLAWRRRPRASSAWILLSAVGLLLALGQHFPFWRGVRLLPVLSGIRFPEKYSMMFLLPLIVAGASGLDQVVMGPAKGHRCLSRALLALAVVAGLSVLGTAAAGVRQEGLARQLATGPLLHLAVVSLALYGLLLSTRNWRRSSRGLAFCVVLAADLVAAGRSVIHTKPVEELASPPAFLRPLLRRGSDAPIFHAAEWHPSFGQAAGTAKPPQPAQWGLAMTLESDFDLTFLRWTDEATQAFWEAIRGTPALAVPLLQRRGTGDIVRFRAGTRWENGMVMGPDDQGPIEAVPVPTHQSLVFAVSRVEIVEGVPGWLAAVARLRAAVRDTACVDSEGLPAFPNPPSPAEVRILSRRPDALVLDIDAKGPAPSYLAFNQTWDTGWRLTIDGMPGQLLRTEISLSGFVVSPGRHRVKIAYDDPWLNAGALISMGACLGCLALLLGRRLRRRS